MESYTLLGVREQYEVFRYLVIPWANVVHRDGLIAADIGKPDYAIWQLTAYERGMTPDRHRYCVKEGKWVLTYVGSWI